MNETAKEELKRIYKEGKDPVVGTYNGENHLDPLKACQWTRGFYRGKIPNKTLKEMGK